MPLLFALYTALALHSHTFDEVETGTLTIDLATMTWAAPKECFTREQLAPLVCALTAAYEAEPRAPSAAREELRAALDALGRLGF